MASVELPTWPGPRSLGWEVLDFGGTLQGPLGGAGQRVNRLGNRWRAAVEMPPMTPADARKWSAALARGLRLGVKWKIRQVNTPTGSPGTPLVAGGSQTGGSLDVDGLNPGYTIKAGQWLSVSTSSRLYLYQAAETVQVDASGEATIEIEAPLRLSPTDNDVVELAAPYIEGLLAEAPSWVLDVDRIARGFGFVIEEAR